jgi:hypothetical protein
MSLRYEITGYKDLNSVKKFYIIDCENYNKKSFEFFLIIFLYSNYNHDLSYMYFKNIIYPISTIKIYKCIRDIIRNCEISDIYSPGYLNIFFFPKSRMLCVKV